MDARIARRVVERIGKGGLDLGRQRVALPHGVVHAFEHGEGAQLLERIHQFRAGEGAEDGDVHDADFQPGLLAQIVAGDGCGLGHAAHADDGVFGVLHAVGLDHVVAPAGELVVLVHRVLQRRLDAVVEVALGDLALHVAVLVLHHARHQRLRRVHEVAQLLLRVADVFLHQFRFGQQHIFDGVRGQEAILHIEEGRLAILGRAAADERQVARALRVARHHHAPARVRHAHDVVVAGVHVEAVAGQRARADVEDDRQPLAGDDVEHLLHQDQPLPRGEVGHAAAGQRKAFRRRGRRMFALRLHEDHVLAPQVGLAVGHGLRVVGAHHRGRGDGVGTCALRNLGLDPTDGAAAVGCGRDARIGRRSRRLSVLIHFWFLRLRCVNLSKTTSKARGRRAGRSAQGGVME